ncbi:MAG: cellulose binding domain-containing protein [Rhodospirillum sp.]|nr:cellulose binding domain-containing protein [Rhodospirillum sp.]MCF8488102.1 cellulose binding domain-containing protein [Rhodospirillum sp.]MCF8501572.1 cellulose binding domain-containing protein [Rhodospirillum sp.]
MDAALLDALPLFGPNPQVLAEFEMKEQWGNGYWGEVTVTAPGKDGAANWSLTLYLPKGWTVSRSWGAMVSEGARPGSLRVQPEAGTGIIPARGQITWGMVVNKDEAHQTIEKDLARLAPIPGTTNPPGPFAPRYMGFNMGSWWKGIFGSDKAITALTELAESNANAVAIVPTQYIKDIHASRIFRNQQTETDENVRTMIRKAKDLGLIVMLKPQVHLEDFGPHQLIVPDELDTFFADFETVMVHYATMAAEEGVELMSLTGELVGLTRPANRDRWLKVIAAVRAVYPGKLTYSANWGEELQVPFWDALDYIGVDMYAPITKGNDPTLAEAVAGWNRDPTNSVTAEVWSGLPITEAMRRLSIHEDKKILFTEIGYRSIDGGGTGLGDSAREVTVDLAEQALLYEAVFTAMTEVRADWLEGIFFWDWDPEPYKGVDQIPNVDDFDVAGKPAMEVAKTWFSILGEDSTPQ